MIKKTGYFKDVQFITLIDWQSVLDESSNIIILYNPRNTFEEPGYDSSGQYLSKTPFQPEVTKRSVIAKLRHVVAPEDLSDEEQGDIVVQGNIKGWAHKT